MAELYATRPAELARKFEPSGVVFIGIASNRAIAPTALAVRGDDYLRFPLLRDIGGAAAAQLGAGRYRKPWCWMTVARSAIEDGSTTITRSALVAAKLVATISSKLSTNF